MAMTNPDLHVTLVHGTFGRHAAWTIPNSEFRLNLQNRIEGRVVYHKFEWSGWPSHIARNRAAENLRLFLHEKLAQNPNDRHFVVAHSHGGNIALYAMRDSSLSERIA